MTQTLVPLGRRLTAVLDTGQHPATGQPILAGEACGSCVHYNTRPRLDGRTKCALAGGRGGPNLPAHTAACALYHPPALPLTQQAGDTDT